MVSSVPARSTTGLHGYHIPPPPEYAVVPPNLSVASARSTERPSRPAVYAPVIPPPEPATTTSTSTSKSGMGRSVECAVPAAVEQQWSPFFVCPQARHAGNDDRVVAGPVFELKLGFDRCQRPVQCWGTIGATAPFDPGELVLAACCELCAHIVLISGEDVDTQRPDGADQRPARR